jgi:hypothetical protein
MLLLQIGGPIWSDAIHETEFVGKLVEELSYIDARSCELAALTHRARRQTTAPYGSRAKALSFVYLAHKVRVRLHARTSTRARTGVARAALIRAAVDVPHSEMPNSSSTAVQVCVVTRNGCAIWSCVRAGRHCWQRASVCR